MDRLVTDINRLSVGTLLPETPPEKGSKCEDGEHSKFSNVWLEQILEIIRCWIGSKFHSYHADKDLYLEVLQREFGSSLDEPLGSADKAGVMKDKSVHIVIKILDKSLSKHWDKINLDYELNGRAIKPLEGLIFLDSLTDEIRIHVWRKKSTEVTKERSNIGSITIPFRLLASNDTKKYSIVHSDEWLKLNIETRNRILPTAAEVLAHHMSEFALNSFRSIFPHLEMPQIDDGGHSKSIKYLVIIRKSAATPYFRDRAHVIFRGQKYSEDVLELELSDLILDEIHLEVDNDEWKRNSLLLKSATSTLKKKNKLAIKPSLTITQSPKNISIKSDRNLEIVLIRDLPWRRTVKVSQKGAYWSLQMKGVFTEGKEFDLRGHLNMFYGSYLRQLTQENRYEWNGELKGPWKFIDVMAKPFRTLNRNFLLLDTLASLYVEVPFNNFYMAEVIHAALNDTSDDDESEGGIVEYYLQCLNRFVGVAWKELPGGFRIRQLQCIVQNLDQLQQDRTQEGLDQVQSTMTKTLEKYLKGESEQVLFEYMDGHAMLMLHQVMGKFQEQNLWVVMFCNAVVKAVLQVVRAKYDLHLDIRKMNRVFVTLLQVQGRSTLKTDDLFHVFEKFVRPWIEMTIKEARTQVRRVIDEESSNHKQSPTKWDDWSEEKLDWLESSIHLNGIFQSCFVTWEELQWNDLAFHLDLGLQLFQGMHEVFQEYVQGYMDIVLADRKFEKHELVIVLHNVVAGMEYLHFFLNTISVRITSAKDSERLDDVEKELMKVSDVLSRASIEADDQVEDIVVRFGEFQRQIFKYFFEQGVLIGSNFEDIGDDEDTLLSHINSLLEFLFKHIESDKYRSLLKRQIFGVLDEELELMFNKANERYEKTKRPEEFEKIASVLPFVIQFRRNMDMTDGDVLVRIHKDLYPRGTGTHDLVATVVEEMAGPRSEGQRGKITFSATYEEEFQTVHVDLFQVEDVPLRKKDKEELPNLFVSMTLFPLTREPYIIRQKTLCFEKRQNLEFDRTTGKFYFHLNRNSFDPTTLLLQLEVSYQLALLHSTVAGLTFIRLEDMTGDKVTKQLVLPEAYALKIVESVELKGRKDPQARDFIRRLENQVHRKKVIQTQEWASEDNHVSSYLIASHLERLLAVEADNPNKKNQTVGHIEVKLGFNETSEDIYIDVRKVEGVRRRLKRSRVQFSVGFRVLPLSRLHAKETFTQVYCDTHYFSPSSESDPMPKEEKCIKMRDVAYNYHRSFLQILLFDNDRPRLLESKAERFFRGHILLPFADIHPYSAQLNFRYVAAQRYSFVSIRADDDADLKRLRGRKDDLAKSYVKEFDAFRDQEGVSYPYHKDEWVERVTMPSYTLIGKHLELLNRNAIVPLEETGDLIFSIAQGVTPQAIEIVLESLSGLVPMADSQTCNFEISMDILPSSKSPYCLNASSGVVKGQTSFIFDLPTEDESPSVVPNKFTFHLDQEQFTLEETFIIFELYDHRLTAKHFRGLFLRKLIDQRATHRKGTFCRLSNYKENTLEFQRIVKLEEKSFLRKKESDVKSYLDRFRRYQAGKPISTVFPYIDRL
ncbi:hypothetical protein TCAL_14785 [Tigriopus californicus]|uniref:MHD1 domain-containing protein n=1 Tax=Tigriopus californicus TaxID=6832 RepID=A0A553PNW3_TIGCA|nr:hypothetical protein TCAL_14785 [Tigriopus californicus]